MSKKTIGIVGGVGPFAGLDLTKKVFTHTKANRDQDHINLILVSCPSLVADRTAYLLEGGENPAKGIETCLEKLAKAGATAVGICCNTAHSPAILKQVKFPEEVEFINMIDRTCRYISETYGKAKVGLLSTLGTAKTGVYDEYFAKCPDLELIKPEKETAESVHNAIYDKEFGIKATSVVSEKATAVLESAITELKEKGCKAVILGCTELPLAFTGRKTVNGTELIDPTDILAVELINATEPEKLV